MAPVKSVESLAQWFDAGYAQDDGNLSGKRSLPSNYMGVDKDNLLVKTKDNGVVVWPVRLNLGDISGSEHSIRSSTLTLYHYTHHKSLAACARIFSQASDFHRKEEALPLLLELLKEDCSSRSTLDPSNPHAGKLSLTPLEPAQFETQADVLKGLFGSVPKEKIINSSGETVHAKEIARCCIALRIPKIMCSSAKLSGDQSESVLVNAPRLERELKRLIASGQQKVANKKSDKKCCFPWPFARKSEQNRSRSKSQQQRKENTEEASPLVDEDLRSQQEEIIRKKRRAIRVQQLNAELLEETSSRVMKQNRYDNVVNAVREDHGTSKSRGASRKRGSLSVGRAQSNGSAEKEVRRGGKMEVNLTEILLQSNNDANPSEIVRLEKSEHRDTMKAKGSWKQLARRSGAIQMQ